MIRNFLMIGVVAALCVSLGACSYFQDVEYIDVERPTQNPQAVDLMTGEVLKGGPREDISRVNFENSVNMRSGGSVQVYDPDAPDASMTPDAPESDIGGVRVNDSVTVFPIQ